jgi:putative endonuclease
VSADSRSARGAGAEAAARRYLEARGLRTLASNFRCRRGEIDLVMRHGAALVIVEVRYRRDARQVHPFDTITAEKQRRVLRATEYLLLQQPTLTRLPVRFDVVAVTGDLDAPQVQWLQAGFDATGIAPGRSQRL